MQFYREFIAEAPEELGAFFAFQIAPPLPFIPDERHGETMCLIVTCWTGRSRRASKSIAPLLEAAPVAADHVGPMPYPALNSAFDALLPAGLQHYWKAAFVSELTDERSRRTSSTARRCRCVESTMHLYPIDGACHRVDERRDRFRLPRRTFRLRRSPGCGRTPPTTSATPRGYATITRRSTRTPRRAAT